jgi:hypothetical protein
MPTLTRRRDLDAQDECWQIYYGDVRVGTIPKRIGIPPDEDPWGWSCGFYPGSNPRECTNGAAATFDQARADFEGAWRIFLANRTEADFQEWRDQQAPTAWKYAMWAAGQKLPSQKPNSLMRCPCGGAFDSHDPDGSYDHRGHIYAAQATDGSACSIPHARKPAAASRPCCAADPQAAASSAQHCDRAVIVECRHAHYLRSGSRSNAYALAHQNVTRGDSHHRRGRVPSRRPLDRLWPQQRFRQRQDDYCRSRGEARRDRDSGWAGPSFAWQRHNHRRSRGESGRDRDSGWPGQSSAWHRDDNVRSGGEGRRDRDTGGIVKRAKPHRN